MALHAPVGRKRLSVFEVFERKKQCDRERSKTKVALGDSFPRWRALKQLKGLKTDALLATFLLDFYEKPTKASSAVKEEPEPASPRPLSAPSEPDEEAELSEPVSEPLSAPPSEPLSAPPSEPPSAPPPLDKCPSCGFALLQWCLQIGNAPNHQPESIEVTLGLEELDEPVSGAEEVEEESDSSEEESEGSGVEEQNSDDDRTYKPNNPLLRLKPEPLERTAAEEPELGSAEAERGPGKRKLCPECGAFYRKLPHECEHKTKPFVCNICGKRCVSEATLKIHGRIHDASYNHACKYCSATFSTRVDKVAHELVHREQNDRFKCPECALTFDTYKRRNQHLKLHIDQLRCPLCPGIVFRNRQHFQRHLAVHTGEKAFRCPVCERGFNQASHLKSHLRLHTGERPYSCRHCGKSFNHNVSLKSHMQRYHPAEWEEDETERGNKQGAVTKSKRSWIPTGRPKGRPKRNAARKIKYSKATDDSDDESDVDFTV